MEFDTKFSEDLYQPVILSNSYLKTEAGDEFGFDSCSSKDRGFFHDLHNLENQDFSILDPIDHHHPPPPRFDDFYEPKDLTMQRFGGGDGEAVAVERRLVPFNGEDVKPVSFVVPDEGSSSITTSAENGYYKELVGGRSKETTRKSSKISRKMMKTSSVKGQWTMDEDRLLIHLVEKHGMRKWSQIAQMLKGRVGKQCRERWHNHLRPDIKKDTWSEEEDKILIKAHTEVGNKWAEIAKRLPGRTENSIKNHWNATKRRQYSRRKCRSKYPRPSSLLQNYIKSLNLDGESDTNPPSSSPVKAPPPPPLPVVDDQMEEEQEEITNMEEEFCASDRLVPNYDFDEVPEFRFNENLFEEGRIDTILDTVGPPPPPSLCVGGDHGKSFEMEEVPLMQSEVKKEMDLMEMINQGNF